MERETVKTSMFIFSYLITIKLILIGVGWHGFDWTYFVIIPTYLTKQHYLKCHMQVTWHWTEGDHM